MINMAYKLKGFVELYQYDPVTGRKYNYNRGPNMIVETGKEFILDEIINNLPANKWNGGTGVRAIAIGSSTDTNAGVMGPSSGIDITILGAAWNGVSEDDYRLSGEFARSGIIRPATVRIDQRVEIYAQFADSQFASVATGSWAPIREVGVFLGTGSMEPAANPQDNAVYRPFAMISRRLYYGINTGSGKYVDAPYWKFLDGNPLMMKYTMEVL